MKCTKFLIIHACGGSLWIDRECPICVNDIQQLTGLLVLGTTMSSIFYTTSKRWKKIGENKYYTKYSTQLCRKGAIIDLINIPSIKFSCHIIDMKFMQHYTKGECTLDTISMKESYEKGEQLNSAIIC